MLPLYIVCVVSDIYLDINRSRWLADGGDEGPSEGGAGSEVILSAVVIAASREMCNIFLLANTTYGSPLPEI